MNEFLYQSLTAYSIGILYAAVMLPMMRSSFSDETFFFRKSGETGMEALGKILLVAIAWPAMIGAIGYHWLTDYIIPWLTQPKT